ncbi:MAG TPA: plasmid partitioning protein RepB C-terminal domain-containing protein [Bryobacteraceae bacterium]|nr:plasmid partitioning protein RepB C-terminal domain-containing protein [Bryobacteraceae bacterium]
MSIKRAFHPQLHTIRLDAIIPIKKTPASLRSTETYKRIEASIDSVGLIEPLVVFPTQQGAYVLLDGHARYHILTSKQIATADCLLATDNESYTYNKRVNYIPPIAQHFMILRALAHVSEQRIAQALNVSVATVREKRDILKGICPEAAELLRNERITADAFHSLRKMKPLRQITVAQLVISAKKFSGRFARALLAGTPEALLEQSAVVRQPLLAPDHQAIIEQETNEMLQHVESIKAHYGNDVLELTATCACLEQLVTSIRVRAYLERHHRQTYDTITQVLHAVAAEREQTCLRTTISD